MRRTGKAVFFVVVLVIAVFTYLAFFGIHTQYGDIQTTHIKGAQDIRWGIDIRGGVDVTFTPADGYQANEQEMAAAESIIKVRMVSQNITDYEVYTDSAKNRIIVRFPWKEDETDFDPQKAIAELGETALLTFREGLGDNSGLSVDIVGADTTSSDENQEGEEGAVSTPQVTIAEPEYILQGTDVAKAEAMYQQDSMTGAPQPVVSLELSPEGAVKFAEATGRLIGQQISIYMDETLLSAPVVNQRIPDGNAVITGMESIEAAQDLANKINAGALPFRLSTENYSTISPTLGMNAKDAMVLAGLIAFAAIAVMMIVLYRLPGLVAVIALTGQMGLLIASVTGFFGGASSFTLTLPGIAGIILSIGMGVDCNVITAERIKEEIRSGKSMDGAIETGFKRAFTAIFDGNITIIIVAIILMGAFGPPGSFFSVLLTPLFFMFGPATAGNIYSFGYTLLMGVIFNFVMGILASRLMLRSVSKCKPARKAWLYGGVAE